MTTKDQPPFEIIEALHEDRWARLLRGVRTADGRPVLLEVLDPRYSRPQDVERLKHEHALGQALDLLSVVKPLALETHEGMPVLVFEDFGGQPLDRSLGAPMETGRFLDLALRVTEAVAELHERDVVHRNLKPRNILVHPATGEVKLLDLGLATPLPRERQVARSPAFVEGSLPYMAPEQTGRTRRAIDGRSDLYALGITFHEMLTGRLPFQARDPLEWVHCHVARAAPPPSEIVREVPEILSAIVVKLLAKMPEDRYQTARGLAHDLARCLASWRAGGRIEPFPLAERDASGRFELPEKLYGREQESEAILAAFKRVAGTGCPELFLISGPPGIGKSALALELRRPVLRERGSFVSGKFDPSGSAPPFSTIVQAFEELVQGALTGSEEQIRALRERLLDALGSSGQLVVDLLPRVELVIGNQPPVARLPPLEERTRIHHVLRRFIGALATADRPLALFLDDLHWADAASLGLLEDLLTHPETRHVLVLAAYREWEVGPSHPLARALGRLRKDGAHVSHLVLGPLSLEHLAALVGDAFHRRRKDAAELAAVVHEKTAGNPFFARQFLGALHTERLLDFDGRTGTWQWTIAEIRAKRFTDNVVELMIEKLGRLPESTREVVTRLACLGNSADVAVLSAASGRSPEQTHADLREAVGAGLVLRVEGSYELLHDRVREAACALVPPERRAEVHLETGRRLLSNLPREALDRWLFDVVGQLDQGAALVTDPREKEQLCRLDFQAGRAAKAKADWASARRYLAHAAALLPPDAWDARYEETLALHLEHAECEYLAGDPGRADELYGAALEHARCIFDRTGVQRARLRFYQVVGRFDDALEVALVCLRLLGVAIPESDEGLLCAVEAEVQRIPIRLRGRRVADLAGAPVAQDPRARAILGLLAEVIPLVYSTHPLLCRLLAVTGVGICLEHGHTEESALVYSWYSSMLLADREDIPAARELSDLSLALNERFEGAPAALKEQLLFHHAALINVWCRPFATSIPLVEQAIAARAGVGDLLGVGYMSYPLVWLLLESGEPLDRVIMVAREHAALVKPTRNAVVYSMIRLGEQLAASLAGATRAPASFDGGDLDEAGCLALLERERFGAGVAFYHIAKQVSAYLDERYAEALEHAESAARSLRAVEGMANEATHTFFHALTLAALHPEAPAERQREIEAALAERLRKLTVWAAGCPANFRSRRALVAAEIARIEGRDEGAMRLYEEAIRSAREDGFVHKQALAHEVASRFYRARGFVAFADTYLREARSCYARWGADAKVRQIDRRHPRLLAPRAPEETATFAARPEQLDLLSVTKASQTISSEIVLDDLIRTLLAVVLEQSGAHRGLLILSRDGALSIEAEAVLSRRGVVTTLLSAQVDFSQSVPAQLVHYVQRTKEHVSLSDASADAGRFSGEEYFQRGAHRSVLCVPIQRQAELLGLLYLENDLLAGAFTPERLTALSLLATQAAIAIDNARLYSKVQDAIEARNEFLSIASHELRTPITSLTMTLQTMDRLLRSDLAPDRQTMGKLIERASRQGTRLIRLCNELLDVSRLHTGRLALEPERVDLGGLVRDVVEQLGPDLARAHCAASISGGGRIIGSWDRSRVEQIVTNLLANAIKFGAGKPIEILLHEEDGVARIAVRDHGIGIEPAKQARIFERFERAVSARKYGGLGLGLYISRWIAEAHGGSIRVESELGAGSTFIVELPCAGPAPAHLATTTILGLAL